jgi:hypothetical protein
MQEREEGGIIGSQPFIPEPNYIVAGWVGPAILRWVRSVLC